MAATLGSYRLDAPLGAGGMGSVWRATDLRTGRGVAVKRLHRAGASSAAALRREIRALARLEHPSVVKILDEGQEDGLPWYAMELVEGRTLGHLSLASAGPTSIADGAETWVDDATLDDTLSSADMLAERIRVEGTDVTEVLTVLRRLAEALAWLHGEGVVHRDLKPRNVIVRPDGRPVLVDFGLTRDAGERREWLELPDRAGSPAYMAPEQCRGEAVDARADLYALGCVIFEMFVGVPPLARSTVEATLQAQLYEPAPRLRFVAPHAPEALDRLVTGLLHKEPERRIGWAGTAVARLVEAGAPVEPRVGPTPRSRLYPPRFTGRQSEVGHLEERIEAAADGRGGLCLIGGESGAGKTRLAMVAARRARDRGLRVLIGRTALTGVVDSGSMQLEALREPLTQLADRAREIGRPRVAEWFGADGALLADLIPGMEAGADRAEPARGERVAAAHRVIERAAEGGQLLILDDLQWADELTLDWVRRHLDEGGRTLVIGTYRTDEAQRLGDLVDRAPGFVVDRLGDGDVAAMAAGMLAVDPVPQALSRALFDQSEGNPFVAAEILRTAVARGLLIRDERDRWVWRGGRDIAQRIDELPVPAGVDALVEQRAAALDPDTREVLGAAAVWGRRVERSAIDLLVGRSAEVQVAELVARQFLEPDEDALRFVHDKIREAVLARLEPERRRALHDRSAGLIADDARRATHLQGAGRLAEAAEAYAAAAAEAAQRGLMREAERLYRAWETCAEQADRDAFATRLAYAELLTVHRREHAGAARQIEAARAVGSDDPEAVARLHAAEANLARGTGDYAAALDGFLAAWEACPDAEDSSLGTAIAAGIGMALHGLQRLDDALMWRERALELAERSGDRTEAARQHQMIGQILVGQGHIDAGEARMQRAQALYEELGNRNGVVGSLNGQAWVVAMRGRLAEAVGRSERALHLARQLGYRRGELVAVMDLASGLAGLGRPEEALRLAEQLADLHQRHGEPALANRARLLVAMAHFGKGDTQVAQGLLQDIAGDAAGLGGDWHDGRLLHCRALVAEARDELDQAAAWVELALPFLQVDPLFVAEAEILQIRIARRRGEDPHALLERLGRVGRDLSPDFSGSLPAQNALERGWLTLAAGGDPGPSIAEAQARIDLSGQGPAGLERQELERLKAAVR